MARINLCIVFAAIAAAFNPLKAFAGEPTSEIREISYRIGGGMSRYDQAYIQLTREKDNKLTLTLMGDCPNEKISFEVADTVLTRCVQLINEHKLWKAKGHYKSEFFALDAPTESFSVNYTDYNDSFSASGEIPKELRAGIYAITNYLQSLRGDRQAIGHFNRKWDEKDILDNKTKWSNGVFSFTPEEEGIAELYRYLSKTMGVEYNRNNWNFCLAEGVGIRALIITNDLLSYSDVFVDTKSANRTSTGGTVPPGRWPKGSRSLLTRNELSKMSEQDILLMENEILARNGATFQDSDVQDYFNKQPWYKPANYFMGREFNDIEDQNMRTIAAYISWYRQHKNK